MPNREKTEIRAADPPPELEGAVPPFLHLDTRPAPLLPRLPGPPMLGG
jgi:hypothetical protein